MMGCWRVGERGGENEGGEGLKVGTRRAASSRRLLSLAFTSFHVL